MRLTDCVSELVGKSKLKLQKRFADWTIIIKEEGVESWEIERKKERKRYIFFVSRKPQQVYKEITHHHITHTRSQEDDEEKREKN